MEQQQTLTSEEKWDLLIQETEAKIERDKKLTIELTTNYNGTPLVLGNNYENRGIIIAESTKQPGHFQATYFDTKGFAGDFTCETLEKAIAEALDMGYNHLEPTLLDTLCTTPEFIAGNQKTIELKRRMQERIEMREWCADSKLKDINDFPTLLYHGGPAGINEFQPNNDGLIWTATDKNTSLAYAKERGGHLYELYANMKNPANITDENSTAYKIVSDSYHELNRTYDRFSDRYYPAPIAIEALKKAGYDGLEVQDDNGIFYAAFASEQIKIKSCQSISPEQSHPIPTETTEFKSWFSDSKAIDKKGNPLVLYHGTAVTDIKIFAGDRGSAGHFAFKPEIASEYADSRYVDAKNNGTDIIYGDAPSIYPVYLRTKNIFDLRIQEHRELINIFNNSNIGYSELEENVETIKKAGFDSYYDFECGYLAEEKPTGIAVFEAEQIKSIHNHGTFFRTNPNILYSGIDPTFGKWNDVSVSDLFRSLTNRVGEAKHHLIELGKHVWSEGYQKYNHWTGKMKAYLTDTWDNFKGHITGVYKEVTKIMRLANTVLAMGACGTFAGGRASTANQENLIKAQLMAKDKINPEQIRQQTGWFQGMDGKWRFEIDDSKAKLILPDTTILKERLQILKDKYVPYEHKDEIWRAEARKIKYKITTVAETIQEKETHTTLDKILKHPQLFKAYPSLKNIDVYFEELPPSLAAKYNPETNSITFDKKVLNSNLKESDLNETLKTLIHEVQHAVQSREGFARGGMPDNANQMARFAAEQIFDTGKPSIAFDASNEARNADYALLIKKWRRDPETLTKSETWSEVKHFTVPRKDSPDRKAYMEEAVERAVTRLKSNLEIYEYANLHQAMKKSSEELQRISRNAWARWERNSTARAQFLNLRGYEQTQDPEKRLEFYKRLAGEKEAYNASDRLDLTAKERRATPPDLSKDAIVIFPNKEYSYADRTNPTLGAIYNVEPKPPSISSHHKDPDPIREYRNQAKTLLEAGEIPSIEMDKAILTSMARQGYKSYELAKIWTASPYFSSLTTPQATTQLRKLVSQITLETNKGLQY